MKKNIQLFLLIIFVFFFNMGCSLERVLNPAPTPAATLPFIPTEIVEPTPTPIPTPEPGLRVESGDQAYFYGDFELAIEEYNLAFENAATPEIQAAALLGLGRTYFSMGDLDNALLVLNGAQENLPETSHQAAMAFALGTVYQELNQPLQAAEAYEAYLAIRPGLIDFYAYELIGNSYFDAGSYQQAIDAYVRAIQSPQIGDLLHINMRIADSYFELGEFTTALITYQDIAARTGNDYTKAEAIRKSGDIFLLQDNLEAAFDSYTEVVDEYPLAYDAYLSIVALLDAGQPVNELNRGLINYYVGQHGFAVDAFVRYISANPGNHSDTAHYYLGLSYIELGNFAEAINAWQDLIDEHVNERFWASAYDEIGYTKSVYLNDFDGAIETYLEFIDRSPGHERSPELLYYAGRTAERNYQLDQAARLWERIGIQFSTSSWAYDGLFQASIARFRNGEYGAAISLLQSALATTSTSGEQAGAYYWIGKNYQKLGNMVAAEESWVQASTSDPTGYYSERATDLLEGREPFTPPTDYSFNFNTATNREEAEIWMKETFTSIPVSENLLDYNPMLSDPRLIRGTELWNLGQLEAARREFESYRLSILEDPANNYRLANYLTELGLYRTGIFAARQVLNLAGMDDAETFSAPKYFNYLRFGAYYPEIVIPVSQAYDFHPMFLYSVIRQESLFEGFVTSTAGARGLMQIIPTTGDSIHKSYGWPRGYTSEDLYLPKVNVTFGADYLDSQRSYFDMDIYQALAAYNGGPGNSANWGTLSDGDPDLFVEVVRFAETRNYIRSIYELFNIYRALYGIETP